LGMVAIEIHATPTAVSYELIFPGAVSCTLAGIDWPLAGRAIQALAPHCAVCKNKVALAFRTGGGCPVSHLQYGYCSGRDGAQPGLLPGFPLTAVLAPSGFILVAGTVASGLAIQRLRGPAQVPSGCSRKKKDPRVSKRVQQCFLVGDFSGATARIA